MCRLLLIIMIVLNLTGCGYNDIQRSDEQIKTAWAEVLNQYQRRAELVPQLVSTIKGYTNQESKVLTSITQARIQVLHASSNLHIDPENKEKVDEWNAAQLNLSRALGQLLIVNERYPELKSQALFQDLLTQLEGTENRIAVARGRYIKSVENYNITIRQFPASLTAKTMGYKEKENYFPENVTSIKKSPVIDFSSIPNGH